MYKQRFIKAVKIIRNLIVPIKKENAKPVVFCEPKVTAYKCKRCYILAFWMIKDDSKFWYFNTGRERLYI